MSMIIFLICLILAWQGFYFVGVDLLGLCKPYSVPSPIGVGERFIELCQDGSIFVAIGNSFLRGLIGFRYQNFPRKGYRRIVGSLMMNTALSNGRLEKAVFRFFNSYYKSVCA